MGFKELIQKHYLLISILTAGAFFNQWVSDSYIPLIPLLSGHFSKHHNYLQFIVPVYYLGITLTQIFVGFFTSWCGRKYFFITGLFICAIGCLFIVSSDNWLILIAGFLIQALGTGFLEPITGTMVVDVFDERSSKNVFSITTGAMGIATVIAPILATLVAFHYHWRWVFILMGAVALFFALFNFKYLKETGAVRKKVRPVAYLKSVMALLTSFRDQKQGFFPSISIYNGFFRGGIVALDTVVTVVLSHQFGLSLHLVGILFALASIAYMLGIWTAAVLPKKIKARSILRMAIYGSILLAALLITVHVPYRYILKDEFLFFFFFVNYAFGLSMPYTLTCALTPFSESSSNSANAASMLTFSSNVICLICCFIVTILHEETVVPVASTLLVFFAFSAFFLEVYLKKAPKF